MRLQIYVFFSNYKQHSNFSILNFEFRISKLLRCGSNFQFSIFNFQFSSNKLFFPLFVTFRMENGSNSGRLYFSVLKKVFV